MGIPLPGLFSLRSRRSRRSRWAQAKMTLQERRRLSGFQRGSDGCRHACWRCTASEQAIPIRWRAEKDSRYSTEIPARRRLGRVREGLRADVRILQRRE